MMGEHCRERHHTLCVTHITQNTQHTTHLKRNYSRDGGYATGEKASLRQSTHIHHPFTHSYTAFGLSLFRIQNALHAFCNDLNSFVKSGR
jgi:hypothetical protein